MSHEGVGAGGDAHQLALGLFPGDRATVELGRDEALGAVEGACHARTTLGDSEHTAPEQILEQRSRHRPVPGSLEASLHALGDGQIFRGERTAAIDFRQDQVDVTRVFFQPYSGGFLSVCAQAIAVIRRKRNMLRFMGAPRW